MELEERCFNQIVWAAEKYQLMLGEPSTWLNEGMGSVHAGWCNDAAFLSGFDISFEFFCESLLLCFV